MNLKQIHYGSLLLLVDERKVMSGEKDLELNPREFEIFFQLIKQAENVVSRESLLSKIDKDSEIFDRTVDSHISHLRTRLKKNGIKNLKISSIYGIGYRLEKI